MFTIQFIKSWKVWIVRNPDGKMVGNTVLQFRKKESAQNFCDECNRRKVA